MRLLKLVIFAFCITGSLFAQNESLLIGPGDQLHIQVLDTPNLEQTARVMDDGKIPLLLGGDVSVVSKSPAEAARVIEQRLKDGNFMYYPHVLVTVTDYATQNVTVFGQVQKPGSYALDTPRSILDVISLAGGLTELADRHIIIERHGSGEKVSAYITNDMSHTDVDNIRVRPGDQVIVPKTGIIYVLGDVGRPGGYPMASNESSLTALEAITTAGATQPSAVPSHARLLRRDKSAPGGYQNLPLPLSDMQKGKKPDVALQADDIIYVPFSYLRNAALGLTNIAASAASAVIYLHQ